jgi:hypothetical protein
MQGYTRIEDLPDLGAVDDFAAVGDGGGEKHRDTHKFIRNNTRQFASGSGMAAEGPPSGYGQQQGGYGQQKGGYGQQKGGYRQEQEMIEQHPVMEVKELPPSFSRPDPMSFNCVDISMHVQQCPICSKFYNEDNSLYIVVIVILAIVCLLLMKRVLNV